MIDSPTHNVHNAQWAHQDAKTRVILLHLSSLSLYFKNNLPFNYLPLLVSIATEDPLNSRVCSICFAWVEGQL